MEWRQCQRFPNYEVSEFGDVRRLVPGPNRPGGYRLKGTIDPDGYLRYSFKVAGVSTSTTAYRLVAEAFLGPPPSPEHEVAHNSGSRVSAYAADLRWATRLENDMDTKVHGTERAGEANGRAKITEADVLTIRETYFREKLAGQRGVSARLAKQYGVHQATLISIATGQSWRHLPLVRP